MKKIKGNGSIYYNGSKKIWVAEYKVLDNGKIKKKSLQGKTKKEASQKLTKIMYEYHNEGFIQENGMPLINLLEQLREDKFAANLISESHYSRLEFVLIEIKNHYIGNTMINEITSRDLQDYFNSLIGRYADSTIKKIWECVKQGFESAVKLNYIKTNPLDNVIKPKSRKETKEVVALTINEQHILAKYLLKSNLNEEKYKNVILLQLYTGMRIGEVLALTKDDLDLVSRTVYVRKTISVDKDGELIVKKGAKTYAGKREIPIPLFLVPHIEEQFKVYENNKNDLLFSYEGRIIKPSTVNTVLKRICKRLKLSNGISNHTLRHTFGTRCIESGMSPVVVQNMMGHKDIRVTLNTYTSVLNQYKQEEFNKVTRYYMDKDLLMLPEEYEAVDGGYLLLKDNEIPYDIQKYRNYEDFDGVEVYKEYANSKPVKDIEKSITKEQWQNYLKELKRLFKDLEKGKNR